MSLYPTNIAASVRQRLLNKARQEEVDFHLLLVRYGLERFLYRLGRSEYSSLFILKGAMLYPVWGIKGYRPTMDADLLGFGNSAEQHLTEIFMDVCDTPVVDDGVHFDPASVRVETIRDETEYGGVRVRLTGHLERARIAVQVDVGFGDVVTPDAEESDYPTLLDLPAPHLRMYPKESVIAEKFQAMIALGMANSRMKDFYDIWLRASLFEFHGPSLMQAISRTFQRRTTEVPEVTPIALTEEFHSRVEKQRQWQAFLSRNDYERHSVSLAEAVSLLNRFLMPVCEALHRQLDFTTTWVKGGPWE